MDGPAFIKHDKTFSLCDRQSQDRSRHPVEDGAASGRLNAVGDARHANDLPAKPDAESPTFKRVRQARRHELWRVAHPYDPDVTVRIICWFPANDQIVLALVGFDKKSLRDVFNASAAAREEAIVDVWLRQKGAPMTEEVKFIRGNDRINQLAQRPDVADGVNRVRAEMAEADRTYAMGLAALRQAAELTQAELARRLGVTQAAIVTFADGHQTTLDLPQLT